MRGLNPTDPDSRGCPLCDNQTDQKSFTAREMMFGTEEEFTYCECAACGSLWIAQVPRDLAKSYGDGYYSLSDSTFETWVRRSTVAYWLAHVVKLHSPPRLPQWWPSRHTKCDQRILDIGSGVGHLLLHLKCLGFTDLLGIDPFIDADIHVHGGPTIIKASLSQTTGQFDVLLMNHSFEHMTHPKEVFAELGRLLAPQGTAVIRTPVASTLAWRRYKADWVQLDAPRHLFVPTVRGIGILAKRSDLYVESVTYDSTAFQFWGSEQYRHGISLHDKRSYSRSRHNSIFTRNQIVAFEREARDLNHRGDGDQASFYLRRSSANHRTISLVD